MREGLSLEFRRENDLWRRKRCLNCRYRLRGLAGDPCRCPECGLWNPYELPSELATEVRKTLQKLNPWARLSALGPLGVAGGLSLTMWDLESAALGVAVASAAIWLAALVRFRSAMRRHYSWLSVFAGYTASGVAWGGFALMLATGASRSSYAELGTVAAFFGGPLLWSWAEKRLRRIVRLALITAVYGQGDTCVGPAATASASAPPARDTAGSEDGP